MAKILLNDKGEQQKCQYCGNHWARFTYGKNILCGFCLKKFKKAEAAA